MGSCLSRVQRSRSNGADAPPPGSPVDNEAAAETEDDTENDAHNATNGDVAGRK